VTARRDPKPPPAAGEEVMVVGLLGVAAVAAWFWGVSELTARVTRGRWPRLPLAQVIPAARLVPGRLSDPLRTWPALAGAGRPGEGLAFYTVAALLAVLVAVPLACVLGRSSPAPRNGSSRWARPGDLRPLIAGRRRAAGRVVIGRLRRGGEGARGRMAGGGVGPPGRLVSMERRHSLLVIGPTQSGKTSGLAIPAILEWRGPVVATSVKDDLAAHTIGWRSTVGPCVLFDPTRRVAGGALATRWSPLSECGSYAMAQKVAAWLVEATPGRTGMADAAFWYTTAAKLLAPLLRAARTCDMTMADIVRWVDTEDYDEPGRLLQIAGEGDAAVALGASAARDERIRSSVLTTLETVLAPFADPCVAEATATTDVEPATVLDRSGTLYLCGPTHEQSRVQGLFAALVSSVVAEAVRRTNDSGAPLDPPLLLVLDEVANIAPVRDLDALASTAAGLGIQLVTVCQDLAQLAARYGSERSRTIANNHRAKLLLSGVSDMGTLDLMSGLAGEHAVREQSTTWELRGAGGSRSTATALRRLAPTHELRQVPPGDGVLLYGHLPPARVRLRPWFSDRRLRARAAAPRAGVADAGAADAGPAGPGAPPVGTAPRLLRRRWLAGPAGGDTRRLPRHLGIDGRPGRVEQPGGQVGPGPLH
jgi:type IV secretion system protein VirD4